MTMLGRTISSRPKFYKSLIAQSLSSLSEVTVTKSHETIKADGEQFQIPIPSLSKDSDATSLVDNLLETTSSMLDLDGSNIVAFSGGIDSSLVAALVQNVFTSSSSVSKPSGNTVAVLGVSPAVPSSQIDLARHVANDIIGIQLNEVPTKEGADPMYIENNGQACLACKNQLYSTLQSVAEHALVTSKNTKSTVSPSPSVILFNGTNKDDTTDPTRLGLIAADNFHVRSPLKSITKAQVRIAAKHLGLPNWNYAASPCLRSRLAMGVEATEKHLQMVEKGETFVRDVLGLGMDKNLRVRLLSGGRAGVELDRDVLVEKSSDQYAKYDDMKDLLIEAGFKEFLENIGFSKGEFVMRKFKSGSVSSNPSAVNT